VDIGAATGNIVIGFDPSGVNAAESSLKNLGDTASGTTGKMAALGPAMGAVGIAGVGMFASAIDSAATFEFQMDAVAASLGVIPGSSAEADAAMKALTDTAMRIGAETKYSANEAGLAMEELAKIGVSTDDIVGGVADATTSLAAAIDVDLASAATAIGQNINAFGLEASDAADITDTLTAAINGSALDLTAFNAGMRQLSPIMNMAGQSLEDTAAAVAYFSNFGLKGADVGVSLARAMENLASPTDEGEAALLQLGIAAFDAQGAFVGWPDLMDQLSGAMGDMSYEQQQQILTTIAGAEAADVLALSIQNGGDGLREMTAQVQANGQAQDQANARMDNFSGAMEQLKGSLEGVAIILGSALTPFLRILADALTEVVNAFFTLSPELQKAISIFGALGSVFLAVKFGLATLTAFVPGLTPIFGGLAAAAWPISLALGAIALAVVAYKTNFAGFAELVDKAAAAIGQFAAYLGMLWDVFQSAGGFGDLGNALRAVFETIDWEGLGRNLMAGIAQVTVFLGQAARELVIALVQFIGMAITETNWGDVGMFIMEALKIGLMAAVGLLVTAATLIPNIIITAITGQPFNLVEFGANMVASFGEQFDNAKNAITGKWDEIKAAVGGKVDEITAALSTAWDNVTSTISDKWSAIVSLLSDKWTEITTNISDKVDEITSALSTAWGDITNTVTTKWNEIVSLITTKWDEIKATITNAVDEITNRVTQFVDDVKAKAEELMQKFLDIVSPITTAIDDIKNNVTSALDALISPIQSVIDKVGDLLGVFDNLKNLNPGNIIGGIGDAIGGINPFGGGDGQPQGEIPLQQGASPMGIGLMAASSGYTNTVRSVGQALTSRMPESLQASVVIDSGPLGEFVLGTALVPLTESASRVGFANRVKGF
jgi:TP901 family phage tail tape measure protein